MHFKNKNTEFFIILFFGAVSFVAGMNLEDMLNLPEYAIMLIGIGLYILAYGIYRLRISLNPLMRIERKIHKLPYKHQQIEMFFDEYIPETRKTFPKTIYKYVYLSDASEAERIALRSLSDQSKVDKWILNSSHRTSNENKLYSLATNSLWFSRSNNPDLNDPFEGRRIIYDDDFIPLPKDEIEYWKQYTEAVRNKLFLCCFSKYSDSPPMWAHYANNYKGFCLEFEIVDPHDLWEVDYGYGKNLPNFEIDGLRKDLWEDRITREEAFQCLEKLHIHWASSKHGDWKYENEIRALFTDLDNESNISYEKIGIKLSAIIIGHNCDEEYCKFLAYIADKLSIPIKTTALNTTSRNYLDIIDYVE